MNNGFAIVLDAIDEARRERLSAMLEARAGPVVDCRVPCGGALAMRPLLLHASGKSRGTSRRRVLHLLFGPADLPFGLRWATTA